MPETYDIELEDTERHHMGTLQVILGENPDEVEYGDTIGNILKIRTRKLHEETDKG